MTKSLVHGSHFVNPHDIMFLHKLGRSPAASRLREKFLGPRFLLALATGE